MSGEIPYGYCHCGCGNLTELAKCTSKRLGNTKGKPRRYIDNHYVFTKTDPAKRFWAKVDKTGTCWEWRASMATTERGHFRLGNKMVFSHRVAWILSYGEIPDGLHVLHHCDNPICCRPDHLFLGTHSDNMYDMYRKKRKSVKGVLNGRSKLTDEQVLAIRNSDKSTAILASEFNITDWCVRAIRRKHRWSHI